MEFKTISVVGLGYIGLPTAAVLAAHRVKVIGVDIDQKTVDAINRGQVHIVEPDLDILVHSTVNKNWLRASTTPEPADGFLIAVPTPFAKDHQPDLSYIQAASASIAPVLKRGDLVVLESTSPVGATEQMAAWLQAARPDLTFPQTAGEASDIRIAHCPERVLPGQMLRELVDNDRVVGGMTPKCSAAAVDLYKIFVAGECIVTNARTAEMCKLSENSFRDVNIAFANELSVICDRLGIDVWELIALANRHPRVDILKPGPGVGGHCIAVDPWFIVSSAPEQARLIRTARQVNDDKPDWVVAKVQDAVTAYRAGKGTGRVKVACLGLAFKPDIDDLRESPALTIAGRLADTLSCEFMLVEPNIKDLPPSLAGHAKVDIDEALEQADIIVLLVAHQEFLDISRRLRNDQLLVAATEIRQAGRGPAQRNHAQTPKVEYGPRRDDRVERLSA